MAMILVGPKLSGDSFHGDELDLLETLASELAIGLKNAQLYHEIVSIKEYNERLLGRMDSGVIAARDDGVVTTFNPAAERILGDRGRPRRGPPARGAGPGDPGRAPVESRRPFRVRDRGDGDPARGARAAPDRPHLGASRSQGRGQRGHRRAQRPLPAQGPRGGQAAHRSPLGPRRDGHRHRPRDPESPGGDQDVRRAPPRAGRRPRVPLDLREGRRQGDSPHRAAPGPAPGPRRALVASRSARSTSRCRWPRRSTSSAARPIAGGCAPWSRSSTTCRRSWASSTS